NRFDAARKTFFPLAHQRANLLALQVLLRSAQRARNERKRTRLRIAREVALADVRQRPDDDVLAVVRNELRRHRLELAAVEQIEEERRDEVVAVMAERDPRCAEFARHPVERAAAQPRAQ